MQLKAGVISFFQRKIENLTINIGCAALIYNRIGGLWSDFFGSLRDCTWGPLPHPLMADFRVALSAAPQPVGDDQKVGEAGKRGKGCHRRKSTFVFCSIRGSLRH